MTDNVNNSHEIDNLPNEANQRGENTEQRVVQAMDKYSKPPMAMGFNRGERSLVQKELVAELARGFEYRRKALDMALETRLHSIREACNHVLVTGKTHLRQQRLEYFGEVLKQVEKRMSDLADDYLQETDQRQENTIQRTTEKELDRFMADYQIAELENQTQAHRTWLKDVVSKFQGWF